MPELTHFSLFSGVGGIDLAAEWAGFHTVGQCEFADYPTKVLEKHWPDVPRWRDVRDVTVESVRKRGIGEITLLSGGFPCQPFSSNGKQRGKLDERYLWPEMLRVITELRPAWVLGENVAGFIHLALDECLAGLESQGYACQSFSIPACGINAPHRRDRIFIVARDSYCSIGRKIAEIPQGENSEPAGICGYDVCRIPTWAGGRSGKPTSFIPPSEVEPGIYRMADGIPKRLDRLKCLGNAVVPQQVFPILKAIKDLHDCNIRDASQLINLAI